MSVSKFFFSITAVILNAAPLLALSTPPIVKAATRPVSPFVREAEIKHGRVAMTSAVVLAALAKNGFEHPSTVLSHLPFEQQALFFSSVGLLDALTYLPRMEQDFKMKPSVIPGDVFNSGKITNTSVTLVEDVVGRVAMLGVTAFILMDAF